MNQTKDNPSDRPSPGRPPDPELRERRTRQILDVATPVFAEHGYDGTDVQVIADEVGVGKGTIYRYFGTKENLFLAALDRGMRDLGQYVEDRIDAEDPLEIVEQAMRGMLAFFDEKPEMLELIVLERAVFKDRREPTYFAFREQHLDPWREMMKGLMAAGRVRQMPVDRVLDVLNDLMYGAIFTNHFAGRTRSLEQQAEDVVSVAFNGILTDSERRTRQGSAHNPAES